eukprot:gene10487-biopygen7461
MEMLGDSQATQRLATQAAPRPQHKKKSGDDLERARDTATRFPLNGESSLGGAPRVCTRSWQLHEKRPHHVSEAAWLAVTEPSESTTSGASKISRTCRSSSLATSVRPDGTVAVGVEQKVGKGTRFRGTYWPASTLLQEKAAELRRAMSLVSPNQRLFRDHEILKDNIRKALHRENRAAALPRSARVPSGTLHSKA